MVFIGTNFVDTSQFLSLSLADLQELGFGSESAGLEYGFIGNMLQNPLEQLTASNQANDTNASSMNLDNGNSNILSITNNTTTTTPPTTTTTTQQQSTPSTTSTGDLSATSFLQFSNAQPNMASYVSAPAISNTNSNTTNTTTTPQGLSVFPMPTTVAFAPGANPLANDKDENASPQQQYAATIAATPPMQKSSPSLAAVAPSSPSSMSSPGKRSNSITSNSTSRRKQQTPESVYLHVKRPFNYAEGFHYLIEYVKER